MSNKQNNTPSRQQPPPMELIDVFLKNQSKELELRSRELEIQKQQDANGFQYAKAALDAQVTDRDAARKHSLTLRRTTYLFVFLLAIIIVFFLCFAVNNGKDAIAMEVIKSLLYIAAGGSGGYALGKKQSIPPAEPSQKSEG